MSDATVRPPVRGTEAGYDEPTPGKAPWKRVHRALRRRYGWTVFLALFLGGLGVALGWNLVEPIYRSNVVIFFGEDEAEWGEPDAVGTRPGLDRLIDSLMELAKRPRVAQLAMNRPEWQKLEIPYSREREREFLRAVTVERGARRPFIYISFSDPDPQVATAAVSAHAEAFLAVARESSLLAPAGSIERIRAKVTEFRFKVGDERLRVIELAAPYGGEGSLDTSRQSTFERLLSTRDALLEIRRKIAAIDHPREEGASIEDLTPPEIAVHSEYMATLLQEKAVAATRLRQLRRQGLGSAESQVAEALENLQIADDRIREFADAFNRNRRENLLGVRTLASLRSEKTHLSTVLEKCESDLGKLNRAAGDVAAANERLRFMSQKLDEAMNKLEHARFKAGGGGVITWVEKDGEPFGPHRDRRKQVAVALAAFGVLLGVGSMFLLGSVAGRLRDTGDLSAWLGERRVLGLLPNLGQESESEAEELGLDSVHRIRTKVEIDLLPGDRRTICITGSSPGAGKSTLTLALGGALSSAGARTLLVDADLQGRGLSRRVAALIAERLRVAIDPSAIAAGPGDNGRPAVVLPGAPEFPGRAGIRELACRALEVADGATPPGRELVADLTDLLNLGLSREDSESLHTEIGETLRAAGCAWDEDLALFTCARRDVGPGTSPLPVETGIDGLQLLPLQPMIRSTGTRVSGSLVREVLRTARETHEVVLVDTGPIPGSLESSLVAAQADAVIVALASGERHGPANRSLRHLDEIGARVEGLLLNRAELEDVRRLSYGYGSYRSSGEVDQS